MLDLGSMLGCKSILGQVQHRTTLILVAALRQLAQVTAADPKFGRDVFLENAFGEHVVDNPDALQISGRHALASRCQLFGSVQPLIGQGDFDRPIRCYPFLWIHGVAKCCELLQKGHGPKV